MRLAAFGCVVLAVLGVLAIGTAPSVEAQQAGRVPRIAVLTTSSPPGSSATDAFIQRLRELGYIEGRNITIEWRWWRSAVGSVTPMKMKNLQRGSPAPLVHHFWPLMTI